MCICLLIYVYLFAVCHADEAQCMSLATAEEQEPAGVHEEADGASRPRPAVCMHAGAASRIRDFASIHPTGEYM